MKTQEDSARLLSLPCGREDTSWHHFHQEAEQIVEAAYVAGRTQAQSSFNNPRLQQTITYTYDLQTMMQTNTATGYQRAIKRQMPCAPPRYDEVVPTQADLESMSEEDQITMAVEQSLRVSACPSAASACVSRCGQRAPSAMGTANQHQCNLGDVLRVTADRETAEEAFSVSDAHFTSGMVTYLGQTGVVVKVDDRSVELVHDDRQTFWWAYGAVTVEQRSGAAGSADAVLAGLAARLEENSDKDSKPQWERIFDKYSSFWQRIAEMASLRAAPNDIMQQAELEFFQKGVINTLTDAGWKIAKPIERILLQHERDVDAAALGCDSQDRKQIARLLEMVQKQEAKRCASEDAQLTSADTTSPVATSVMGMYDRLLQAIAWLAGPADSPPTEGRREDYRSALLNVARAASPAAGGRTINIAGLADQVWALADSGIDISDDIISQMTHGLGGLADGDPVISALMRRLLQHLRVETGDVLKRRSALNMAVLTTLMSQHDDWNPKSKLHIKLADELHDMWERFAQLVHAPDLARCVRDRRTSAVGSGIERQRVAVTFSRMHAVHRVGFIPRWLHSTNCVCGRACAQEVNQAHVQWWARGGEDVYL
jgi:hypothetical protein